MKQSFHYITGTITRNAFFNEYFQRKPLHVARNQPDFFNRVLTVADLDAYLDRLDIHYPSVRLVKNGKELPQALYVSNQVPIGHHKVNGIIDKAKMFDLFNDGATIVIQAGQRYFSGVTQCCMELAEIFGAPVQANLYITPKRSQGFNPHWDTHEVMVLQISGTKTWNMYDFGMKLPTKNQPYKSGKYKAENPTTLQIQPGDFLYVPRGFVHDAIANDGISAHITLGILNPTWMRWINELTPLLENHESFREAMPFWEEDTLEERLEEKRKLWIDALQNMDVKTAAEKIKNSWYARQPEYTGGRFASLVNMQMLGASTTLAFNRGLRYGMQTTDKHLQLTFLSKQVQLPAFVKPLIEFITTQKIFTPAQLPAILNNESNMRLLKTLLEQGFIRMAEDKNYA